MSNIDTSKMTADELRALVAKLQSAPQGKITVRCNDEPRKNKEGKNIDPTGTISVYGLQKFPVSLFAAQWERLFEVRAEIEALFPRSKAFTDKAKAAKAA